MRHTDQEFAEIYNASQTRAEAATRLGMTHSSVQGRAYKIRKAGKVELKRFSWGKPGLMTWLREQYPAVYEEWKGLV